MSDDLTALAEELGLTVEHTEALVEFVQREGFAEESDNATFNTMSAFGDGDARVCTAELPEPPRRYEDLGEIATGGMGEVRRVRDVHLNRIMAMKVIRADKADSHAISVRFREEAQATAQLQHPGIVPVHELGRLPDGRFYFTMMEVKGRTLKEVILAVHEASGPSWGSDAEGWSFRRLISAFQLACEAVAYAHDCGVLHRDIKPSNIMLGAYGEVLVLDWGIAKVKGQREAKDEPDLVLTERSRDDSMSTRLGEIAGTPAYMPREQALGEPVDERADVYSLGSTLYYILAGHAPYPKADFERTLNMVRKGPPPSLRELRTGPPIDELLIEICETAMARHAADRYPNAAAMALAVNQWLDGARRMEQALRALRDAESGRPAALVIRSRIRALRDDAARILAGLPAHAPEALADPAWTMLDQADALELEAERRELDMVQDARAALGLVPDLPQAHALLAEHYRALHERAERERDPRLAARAEVQLRYHDQPGQHQAYLDGAGTLTLVTEPPGAEVMLYRYQERSRRLIPAFERYLGLSPLVDVNLEQGSWFLMIRGPGMAELRYPVCIGRMESWNTMPPDSTRSHPLRLPLPDELGSHECLIPEGWFWAGGDGLADASLERKRLWSDCLVMARHPVTNAEYVAFLNALVQDGRAEAATRCAPRLNADADSGGAPLYGKESSGHFVLLPHSSGIAAPDAPVVLVDHHSARAYARWYAETTGQPWRLPGELEWEKAARGVDGRLFPWGNHGGPTRAHCLTSRPGQPGPVAVDASPIDESPYGVRGLGGNVREWTAEAFLLAGHPTDGRVTVHPVDGDALIVVRGGSWRAPARKARAAAREAVPAQIRASDLGFRLVRDRG